ncbi:MAG: site-specific integrase [Mesorhizobium sp.]|nr:MAG: site-specific integrase [Mesorhizobium sp.]
MPRPSKGIRLVWRSESRKADGSLRSKAGWYIEDAGRRHPTGCGKSELVEAQRQLADYIGEKHQPTRQRNRDPDQVKIADVINVYAEDVVALNPSQSYRKETAARLLAILTFFTGTVADISGALCREYVNGPAKKGRILPTPAMARRQLEDLRAAINHYHAEKYITAVPKIVLPARSEKAKRALTRSEAARLLWAAWQMRQTWKGQESDRRTGRHVARFILTGLYTGTRSAAICGAATRPTVGRGFVDLERGVFFRRAADMVETRKRQPPVRLPDRLLAHMRRWARTPVDIKTKGRGKSRTIGRMIAHDFIVEWEGGPVRSVRKAFKSACESAGLGWYEARIVKGVETQVFVTDVTPHTLRHTAATWLMQNGVELSKAADFCGMTEAVLRKHYYHHHPDFQADAAAAITAKAPMTRQKSNIVRSGVSHLKPT